MSEVKPLKQLLKEHLSYNPKTGDFKWTKKSCLRIDVGSIAGGINSRGYTHIMFKGKSHKAHRLAWLFYYGEWPNQHIDHINGIPSDNRICNLRDVSHRENGSNRKEHRSGKLPGAFKIASGKWLSRCQFKNKKLNLGLYEKAEDANGAYRKAVAFVLENPNLSYEEMKSKITLTLSAPTARKALKEAEGIE